MRNSHWTIKTFLLTALPLVVASCNPMEISGKTTRSKQLGSGSYVNSAFIYRDSPALYTEESYGPANPDMSQFIDKVNPEVITTNSVLTGNCSTTFLFGGISNTQSLDGCIRSLTNTESLTPLARPQDRSWIFNTGSNEFYQVNVLYHVQKATDTFLTKLKFAYDRVQNSLVTTKSIPYYLKDSGHFWFKAVSNADSRQFKNSYLSSYALCNNDGNSSFDVAGPDLCFGYDSHFPGFQWAQDPSVIYHEFGHAMVSVMMNLRNGTSSSSHKFRSNLGSYGYEEAGAIGEGVADWISTMITKRHHVGEWAMGRTQKASRPTIESDSIHISAIKETSEGRLSYPLYILYDPNFPNDPYEDVHYAGQIVSHYLTALAEQFKTKCSLSSESDGGHDTSSSYVMLLMAETFAEIGDLNARGGVESGYAGYYFTNLDSVNSFLWTHIVNQTNYRRFFQIFAKNINKYISATAGGICPSFTKTDSEKLLDDYGLLLFKSYNDNYNSTKNRSIAVSSSVTAVSESNRRKSVLVSKQLLTLATKSTDTPNAFSYYIIDNRSDIAAVLSDLLFKGLTVPITSDVASPDYNNGNIKISPGEIVAVIPNLYNGSNSTMAGVQILANDWDHVNVIDENTGYFKPCVLDATTTVDQGGQTQDGATVVVNSVTRTNTCNTSQGYPDSTYQRLLLDKNTNKFPANAAAPACLVLLEEGDSSRWVSQAEFSKKQGLSLRDKDCLGYSASGSTDTDFTFNPHECLARFLPGANDAFFSKIDPQKNYYESVVSPSQEKQFNSGNILLMEINKWVPPGTKFRCRMRARFSNCSDCYTDPTEVLTPNKDDYLDSDFNGNKPFSIINFDFEVND